MRHASRSTQSPGFAVVEALLIGVAVVLVAVAGYAVLKQNAKADKTPTASEQVETASTPKAPAIDNTSNLTAAEAALDQTNIDASTADTTQLDSQLNGF